MKVFFKIILIIFIISTILTAQDRNETNLMPKDSLRRHLGINPRLKINYEFNGFYGSFEINRLQAKILYNDDPSTVWLRTELALSNSSQFNSNNPHVADDLTQPLYRQYIENSKFNVVTYILGMAQAAAVGYMAYQHIKKYGFWK
ncbi:hypothetical protein BMS3Abin03_02916 [bacterium BMS3Abin03]|nr:hypothetical protein BMS3Abin03_02916 [bacterium BMS3Abin03]